MLENFQVTIGNLVIKGPFTIPSGIVTTTPSVISRLARDVPALGFLTTKTISIEPRAGYREPIIHEYYPGCFINAVGLANPGAHAFLGSMEALRPLHENKPLVISIMGSSPEEFLKCAKILDPIADAFEINLSCPHVKGAGQSVGSDPELVKTIVGLLKHNVNKPVIPKLSPNISNFEEITVLCEREGADGLTLINTVGPGTALDMEGCPVLSNVNGGISGGAIKPLGLKLVREAAGLIKIPIIACGGISEPTDILAYKSAGASLFGIGSSMAFLETSRIPGFFEWLATGLDGRTNKELLQNDPPVGRRTDYKTARVVSNNPVSENMFELSLGVDIPCDPGQFFFLRIPYVGEKPFSPMSSQPLTFLVRAVGPFTNALQQLIQGSKVQLRGPYGSGFPKPRADAKLIMVGGGTGAGPIIMAAKKFANCSPKVFLGFSSDVEISPIQQRGLWPENALISIDSRGNPGKVIQDLSEKIFQRREDFCDSTVFVCGPKPMMQSVFVLLKEFTPAKNIYQAREDIMKCGIGICGSCGTPSGLRSCVDGPVINGG